MLAVDPAHRIAVVLGVFLVGAPVVAQRLAQKFLFFCFFGGCVRPGAPGGFWWFVAGANAVAYGPAQGTQRFFVSFVGDRGSAWGPRPYSPVVFGGLCERIPQRALALTGSNAGHA